MDHVTTPIFEEGWGADEELLLLEAIEMFGFGNWAEVADHIGQKTKEQCEAHYHAIYLDSATAPTPDLNAPLRTADSVAEEEAKKLRAKVKPKPKAAKPPSIAEQVGYAEKREEFEVEYENDAEALLADMEFKEDDTKWEKELKLKVVEIYNSKLDARLERKKFVVERGLLLKKENKRTKEEEDIHKEMKVFARFQTPEEHEALIQGLVNEHRLRKRIEQLQTYRQNGIRTLAEAEEFDKDKSKKADTSKKKKEKHGEALLDISGVEGSELLSEQERDLCSQLGLIPQHYMITKERMIHESYTRGFLQPAQARQLIKIDAAKTDKLYEFFVSVGWVHQMAEEPAKKESAPPSPPSYPSYPFYPPTTPYQSFSYPPQQPAFSTAPYLPSATPFQFAPAVGQALPYNSMMYTTPAAFPSSPTYTAQPSYGAAYPFTAPFKAFTPTDASNFQG